MLLELLSGRRAVDKTKIGVEQNLVDWAKPYLCDKRRLFRIMDTKLEGQYPQKGAFMAATLALQCLNTEAKVRPRMSEVLATLEQIQSPKNAAKHIQSEQHTVSIPVQKSPLRQQHSPLNLTPRASPLPSYRQSPRVRWMEEHLILLGIYSVYSFASICCLYWNVMSMYFSRMLCHKHVIHPLFCENMLVFLGSN